MSSEVEEPRERSISETKRRKCFEKEGNIGRAISLLNKEIAWEEKRRKENLQVKRKFKDTPTSHSMWTAFRS